MEIRIDAPAAEKIRSRFSQAPQIVRPEMAAGMQSAADVTLREIRTRTPGRGGLRQAIQPKFNASRTEASITVFPGRYTPIARYQESGTGMYGSAGRMYEIRPRVARVLRFVSRGGSLVFTKRVLHPGVKPHWMFRDGTAAARPTITRIFAARLGQVTRRLGKTG